MVSLLWMFDMYLQRLIFSLAIMFPILFAIGCSSGGGGSTSSTSSTSSSTSSTSSSSGGLAVALAFPNLYALADFPVGTAVSAANEEHSILGNNATASSQRNIIQQHFSQITPGNIMKMSYLHNAYDTFTFGDADALIDYVEANGIGIHAHSLIWHSDYQVPDWARQATDDLQAKLDHHVTTIAGHFAGKVDSWDVVNEAIDEIADGEWGYRDSIFYQKLGKDYIANAFIQAREADPEADLYYNDYGISNANGKFEFMLQMVDEMLEQDLPIDGIGFQMHVYLDWPAIVDIRSAFRQVVDRGLKVKITELDIPINNPFDGSYRYPDNYVATFTQAHADAQKQRYCQIAEAYLQEVPVAQRGGLTIWGVYDGDTWLNSALFEGKHIDWPLLFDTSFRPKPAAQGVGDGLSGLPCAT